MEQRTENRELRTEQEQVIKAVQQKNKSSRNNCWNTVVIT